MNYYDARVIMGRVRQGLPVHRAVHRAAQDFLDGKDAELAARPVLGQAFLPTFDTLCECGARYGMHRVNDYACPSQEWLPGNGKPQWLTKSWKRASSKTVKPHTPKGGKQER
jgi:hypothetical protein